MNRDLIAYGGGGKGDSGTARVAQEAPDSLRSQAFAKVLDLVCEGPIKGLVNGFQSIYLDGTPLQNSDGTLNFQGVGVDYRLGTQAQTYIAGFAQTESEIAVSVQIKATAPVVRTLVSGTLVDAVRITVSVPQLTQQNTTNGDLNGSSVTLAIDLDDGGGFVQKILDEINGKTTSTYQRNYTIEVAGPGPHTIRIRRITPDSTSSALQNQTYWDSYTIIEDGKLRYPNSAIIATMVDASQFQSIPTRAFDLYLREIQVPTNYDPIARTYTGVWDGTFKIAWTDNPAWCWLDLVTSTRFGLGRFVSINIVDKWALYQISQYCDELVPDGMGGMEPRFTCNLYLQTREEAFKVINNMASVFRGITYWGSALLSPVQDAPGDPVALFTPANVVNGEFSYTGTDFATRHTVAVVQWNNPANDYKQEYEYVEGDADDIDRYGVIQTEVVAMGCTSRGQANRVGRWTLYSEIHETEAIAFSVGIDGALARPGQIIQVQDPTRATVRLGGRIMDALASQITLDADVVIDQGKTYTIACMLPEAPAQDPTKPKLPGFGALETRNVTNAVGTTSIITVDAPFSQIPQQFAIWIIAVNDLVPQTFRVLGVTEDTNNKLQFSISAVSHNPSKFAHVDLGALLQDQPITKRPLTVPAPIGVTITQHEHTDSLGVTLVLSVSWTPPGPGLTYHVEYRKDNGNWISLGETGSSTIDIPGTSLPGNYQARALSINSTGKTSTTAVSPVYTLVGKLDVPPGLTDLRAEGNLWEIDLFWDFAPNQPDGLSTDIWVSRTNDRSTAVLLISQPYPQASAVQSGLENGEKLYYWGRVANTSTPITGIYSPWFPSDPFAGISATTLNDASKILSLVSGQLAQTNAGLTLAALLDNLDPVSNGYTQQFNNVQTALQSLHDYIDSLGARLDSPNGDIANAISRIESSAAVAVATPYQGTAPTNPSLGDAWYDLSSGGALRFWNGLTWIFATSAIQSPNPPLNANVGDLWLDNSNSKHIYRIWNGSFWINTARATIYAATQPPTVGHLVGDTWKNTLDQSFWVFDGTIWVNAQNTNVAAIAAQVTALQTQVNGSIAQIQQNITSIAGYTAIYSLKIDINGHVSGFAFDAAQTPNGVVSDFVVDATRFAVGDSNISADYPFIITNGQVYIKSAYIQDASVGTLKIAGQAIFSPVFMQSNTSTPVQASITMPSGNSGIAITGTMEIFSSNNASSSGPTVETAVLKIIRNDGLEISSNQTTIQPNTYATCIVTGLDIPNQGTWTYRLDLSGGSYNTVLIPQQSTILLLGAKR